MSARVDRMIAENPGVSPAQMLRDFGSKLTVDEFLKLEKLAAPQEPMTVAEIVIDEPVQTAPVQQSRLYKIAMAAIARGENRVLPIEVGGKNPLIKWKDSQLDIASTEEWAGLAEAWAKELAQRFPNSNVCVIAKPLEYLFIDCDTTREFIAGFEAWSSVKFPITYTTSARDNRTQMHFRQTDATRALGNVAQFAVDGIDFSVRQKNLYVLAEGSQHPSGSIYQRVVDAPIAMMPDKLVEYIQYLRQRVEKNAKDSGATDSTPRNERGHLCRFDLFTWIPGVYVRHWCE